MLNDILNNDENEKEKHKMGNFNYFNNQVIWVKVVSVDSSILDEGEYKNNFPPIIFFEGYSCFLHSIDVTKHMLDKVPRQYYAENIIILQE